MGRKQYLEKKFWGLTEKVGSAIIPTQEQMADKERRSIERMRIKRKAVEARATRAREYLKEQRKLELAQKTIEKARESKKGGFLDNIPDFSGFMGIEDPFASRKPKRRK